jgi:hypothetical protein
MTLVKPASIDGTRYVRSKVAGSTWRTQDFLTGDRWQRGDQSEPSSDPIHNKNMPLWDYINTWTLTKFSGLGQTFTGEVKFGVFCVSSLTLDFKVDRDNINEVCEVIVYVNEEEVYRYNFAVDGSGNPLNGNDLNISATNGRATAVISLEPVACSSIVRITVLQSNAHSGTVYTVVRAYPTP